MKGARSQYQPPIIPYNLPHREELYHEIAMSLIKSSFRTLVKCKMALTRPQSSNDTLRLRAEFKRERAWLLAGDHWAFALLQCDPEVLGDVVRKIDSGEIPSGLLSYIQQED